MQGTGTILSFRWNVILIGSHEGAFYDRAIALFEVCSSYIVKGGELKKGRLKIVKWAVILVFINFVSGCNGGTPVDPTSFLLSPTGAVLLQGQTLQFNAVANGVPLANPIWFVNGVAGGTGAIGTISSTGLFTAPIGSGTTSVLVTAGDAVTKTHSYPSVVSIFQPSHFPPAPSRHPTILSSPSIPSTHLWALRHKFSLELLQSTASQHGLNRPPTPEVLSPFWWRACAPVPHITCRRLFICRTGTP